MKQTKEIIIPEKKGEEHTYFCDICKKELYDDGMLRYNTKSSFDFEETELSCSWGTRYSDSGNETKMFIDICKPCLKNKIIPLIEEKFSIKARTEERDW